LEEETVAVLFTEMVDAPTCGFNAPDGVLMDL
jgi:hypothetical protein